MSALPIILQPISTGDLIDRSVRFYRSYFGSLLLVSALPGMVAVAGGILRSYGDADWVLSSLGNGIAFFVAPVMNLMLVGGVGRALADHLLRERPFSFRAVILAVRSQPTRLLRAALLGWFFLPLGLVLALIAIGLGGIFGSATLLATADAAGPRIAALGAIAFISVLGASAGVFVFLQLYGRVVLLPAVVAIEEQPVGQGFRRAFALGRRNWTKVLGILAFEYCLTWSVFLALAAPVIAVAMARGYQPTQAALEKVALGTNVLLHFSSICAAPIALVAFSMLYFDSRVRKEGFDMQYLLERVPGRPS